MSSEPPQRIDPAVPDEVYADPALGPITSVQVLDLTRVIVGAPELLYLVNHTAPGAIVRCEDWGDHLRVYQNNFALGFVNNILLTEVAAGMGLVDDPRAVVQCLARKLLAERILVHSDNDMGRTLFLEALLIGDPGVRAVVEAKAAHEALRTASDAVNHLAADFMMFHEIGHVGRADERYAPYAAQTIEVLDEYPGFDTWRGDERRRVIEEVFSDIFAVNTLFERWHTTMSAASLRSYLARVVEVIARLAVVEAMADELVQLNVDEAHISRDVGLAFLEWEHRTLALRGYIENFAFGPETVEPVAADALPPLPQLDTWPAEALHTLTDPLDPHARRMASLISTAFAPGASFRAIVDAGRVTYEFKRWSL